MAGEVRLSHLKTTDEPHQSCGLSEEACNGIAEGKGGMRRDVWDKTEDGTGGARNAEWKGEGMKGRGDEGKDKVHAISYEVFVHSRADRSRSFAPGGLLHISEKAVARSGTDDSPTSPLRLV